jgi:MFS family permease
MQENIPHRKGSGASVGARLRKLVGGFRVAYLPILTTYFAFGASAITAIATLYLQKETLKLTPVEVAEIGFWLGLPWSMKMVAGVASDSYPILGSRRFAYLLVGAACSVAGFAAVATVVTTKAGYLLAMLLITVGFMIQDVVADALSVEVARSDEELGQIQALGRMALLAGGISVGYLGGVLAGHIGPRNTFALAMLLPALVLLTLPWVRGAARQDIPSAAAGPLGDGKASLVLAVGLGYAALGAVLTSLGVAFAQEIVLVVSLVLIALLLRKVGISAAVAVARAFETSRRRDTLDFTHHAEVAALPAPEADARPQIMINV